MLCATNAFAARGEPVPADALFDMPPADLLNTSVSTGVRFGGQTLADSSLSVVSLGAEDLRTAHGGSSDLNVVLRDLLPSFHFLSEPLTELFAVLAHHLHLPFLEPDPDPHAPALPAVHAHLLQALDDAVRELNSGKIDQILLALEVHAPAAAVVIRTMVRDLRYQQLSAVLTRAAPRAEPG
ncbi:MAG: hypothetical protein V4633_20775 [Pseudomonadota bacterium]